MAKCGYCGSTIFGGVRDGNQRFCNNKCLQNGYILKVSQNVPPDVIERQVEEIFRGNCSRCRGVGPIDVHEVYEVWSALVLTRWTTTPKVCCRSCATRSQLGGLFFSLFCGWWGFPWGLILTPVQITRNIAGICRGQSSQPSADLRKLVQVNLGLQAIQQKQAKQPPPIPKTK